MWIYELTCPFETRIDQAHEIKQNKYDRLIVDLKDQGYQVVYEAFEVGSRGQITKKNKERLKSIYELSKTSHSFPTFMKNISVISVLGSFVIFTARKEKEWNHSISKYLGPIFVK